MSDDPRLSAHVYAWGTKQLIATALCSRVVFFVGSFCCPVFFEAIPDFRTLCFFLPLLSWSYPTEYELLSRSPILTSCIWGANYGKRLEKFYPGMWLHFQSGSPPSVGLVSLVQRLSFLPFREYTSCLFLVRAGESAWCSVLGRPPKDLPSFSTN